MKKDRMNEIKAGLEGLGTRADVLYTNQEIIDELSKLQSAIAAGVFEKTHAENLRDRDVLIHFEALAKEYGLNEAEQLKRFGENMRELGYIIGTFKKGMRGESIARRALKLLDVDRSVRILYNVQLEDGEIQAEYDAIVIAPYGVFVVEVKNWRAEMNIDENGILRQLDGPITYDIPGKMSIKEALLRKYLETMFPSKYVSMLLLANEEARITDNYHKISVHYGAGIGYEIKEYAKTGRILSDRQINAIADRILACHKVQKSLCEVDCEAIIEDYAFLMAEIEERSKSHDTFEVADNNEDVVEKGDQSGFVNFIKKINWKEVGFGLLKAAAFILPGAIAIMLGIKKS